MRRTCRYIPVLVLLLCCLQLASAQSLIDVNIGFGATQAKALSQGIDSDTFLPCSAVTVNCSKTPSLNSFNLGFGGNLMLWKHFGVGMDATLQPGKQTYANLPPVVSGGVLIQPASTLQSRVTLYDFNGIFQPVNSKRATLQLIGGVGGANIKFYDSISSSSLLGNSNYSQYFSSSNHFNLHAGVGVQIYVNDHVYVRPQIDLHYIPNFTQFGTNLVKQYMVWVGYTIGDRQ